MQYYVKTIGPLIKSKYETFTQVEKSIADFFMTNQKKMDFSAKHISEMLYVSEASLSRFAKKCGFRGYREFIYQYEESLLERKGSITGDTRTVLNIYQELVNSAYNLTDELQIARIVKYLNEAERVIVCGKGSSGLAANEMENRFMRVGVNIDSLQESDRMRMQAVFLNKSNLVIGLSMSGETADVLYLLEESHARGAKTVLFTGSSKGDFSRYCDEVLLVPSLKYLNQGHLTSPQMPMLLMADIIYICYVNQDKYGKELLRNHTLRAIGKTPMGEKSLLKQ